MREKILFLEKLTRGAKWRSFLGKVLRAMFPKFWFYPFLAALAGRHRRVNVLGRKFVIDLRDEALSYTLFFEKIWEPEETAFMLGYLKKGMVFVDIGANIGYYSVLASQTVGANGRVVAFEPDPKNLGMLKENLRLNACWNVTVEEKALTDKRGLSRLYLSHLFHGDHRSYEAKDDAFYNRGHKRPSIEVETVSLDEYLASGSLRPDFIKMDIQGSEYRALGGMKETLRRNQNVVLFTEFWPAGLVQAGASPELFLKELDELGFSAYLFQNGGLEKADHRFILSHAGGTSHKNLIFVRGSINLNKIYKF